MYLKDDDSEIINNFHNFQQGINLNLKDFLLDFGLDSKGKKKNLDLFEARISKTFNNI